MHIAPTSTRLTSLLIVAAFVACSGNKKSEPEAKTVVQYKPPGLPKLAPAVPLVPFQGPTNGTRLTKLLRFPDIHGDLVVFTYAGDLWLINKKGGTASRLTSNPGLELFAKFSPDGKWIAFTGQYGGDEQVYVVPTTGGEPRQLTFYPAHGPLPARWGYDNQVYGWTPDGKQVLFRSMRDSNHVVFGRLYLVPATGGLPKPLPMIRAGAGDIHGSGTKLLYSPLSRDFRTWKRYQGGWAQDLYVYNLKTNQSTRITKNVRTDRDPMWLGDVPYFASDRSGTLNLYRYAGGKVTPVTSYKTWDVRWPSSDGKSQIVFELDGELKLWTAKGVTDIPVYVPDDGARTRPERIAVKKWIQGAQLGPTGKRVLFVARGDVFSAPVEHGPTRNLTHSSNAHDKQASWSPDGKQVAYVSDWTGEDRLWLVAHDQSKPPRALTKDHKGQLWAPLWSPDGKRIAYSDHEGNLFVVTVATGAVTRVARDPMGRMSPDYQWSPDSRWLAYSERAANTQSSIYVWRAADQKRIRATGPLWSEWSPSWHPSGKYLYYLSNREFHPQISWQDFGFMANRSTGVFAIALTKDAPNPLAPRNDVAGSEDKDKHAKAEGGPKKKKPPVRVTIDEAGLSTRVVRVPIEVDNYGSVVATDDYLVYGQHGPFYYGRKPKHPPDVMVFSFKKRKSATLVKGVSAWSLSRDGHKLLVRAAKGGKWSVRDVAFKEGPGNGGGKGDKKTKTVTVDGLVMHRVPQQEWRTIFNEVWRRFRDQYYVSNMHGYDWKAIGDRYRPLLEYVGHRSDLNYVIGEMIAELSTSHSYISGGDERLPPRPPVALLGARFELDATTGLYRFADIFDGQNAEPDYRSPLTEVGVHITRGDYLLAINGRRLAAGTNPFELLQLAADKPVELLVSARATGAKQRRVLVRPIKNESSLLYLRWVEGNREHVAEATNGQVGYLHLPDMGADGIREFSKWYLGQHRKAGLIVDVRANGGGNVSQLIIERLSRKLLGTDFSRTTDVTSTYPRVVFHGHMACLINETSGSDGDIFPYMFRKSGLGPLIGKRTWGGVVGITNHGPLLDGGQVFVPEFATASAKGQWVIEGKGVTPDIEVQNDPTGSKDEQLDRAIAEVMKKIKAAPMPLPKRPPPPVHKR